MKSKPKAMFIGRYQTVHEGHKYLFRQKINEGVPVLICIRDMQKDDKNPYSPQEVISLFKSDAECVNWIQNGEMEFIVIPDIVGVYYGRDVGYAVEKIEVPDEIASISATKLRQQNMTEAINGKL